VENRHLSRNVIIRDRGDLRRQGMRIPPAGTIADPVPLYMTLLRPEPGTATAERIRALAESAQTDPAVRGYRSFHSPAEGRIVWLLEAASKDAVLEWAGRAGFPVDAVTELELEGHVGVVRKVRHAVPNQLPVVLQEAVTDGTLTEVTLRTVEGDIRITALCDSDEFRQLAVKTGDRVDALLEATDVSLAIHSPDHATMKLSFPNQIVGKVVNIIAGPSLVIVHVDTPAGTIVSAIIPSAAEGIDLKVGDTVTTLFKALDVSLAKD